MSLVLTPEEVKRVLSGQSDAVTRAWIGPSPYSSKDVITLSASRGSEQPMLFANAEVLSVRPSKLNERSSGNEADIMAGGEGFESSRHWRAHWDRHFSDRSGGSFILHRIRFAIKDFDKKVVEALNAVISGKATTESRSFEDRDNN